MKNRHLSLALVLSLLTFSVLAAPRDALWKEVEEAVNKGLPKTAIEKLQPIIDGAIKEKKYAEAVKAIGKKLALEGTIQGNKPEEKIKRMRAEIDKQFQKVLASADVLKKISIAEYNDLLEKGTTPDGYRPTLYDFLAQNALEFYAAGEQAASRQQDAFDLSADGPIFGSVDEFLAWKPETQDEDSKTLKALHLYQDLIRFHQKDDDRSALLDADLLRLEFGNNKAFGE